MRAERRTAFLTGLAVVGGLALALACKDSNMVTAPASTSPAAPPSASIAGTWTGTFVASGSADCGSSTVSAAFQQTGSNVTGSLNSTGRCGMNGHFTGTIAGSAVTGSVEMTGCSGGGTSGMVHGSSMSLQIGDIYRSTGQVAAPGGSLTLSR